MVMEMSAALTAEVFPRASTHPCSFFCVAKFWRSSAKNPARYTSARAAYAAITMLNKKVILPGRQQPIVVVLARGPLRRGRAAGVVHARRARRLLVVTARAARRHSCPVGCPPVGVPAA